jgi:hypothetical protein
MKEVIESLNDSQRGVFRSKEYLRDQIYLLIKIAPQYFKILHFSTGIFLKLLIQKPNHFELR